MTGRYFADTPTRLILGAMELRGYLVKLRRQARRYRSFGIPPALANYLAVQDAYAVVELPKGNITAHELRVVAIVNGGDQ